MLVSFPAQESRSRFKVHRTQTSSLIMCGSIEVDVWRARIGIFAARIASRLPKGWRKAKRQVASTLFTQCVFAGGGACSSGFGCGSGGYKREARLLAVLMSLLLATSVMNVSLLLRCGDIESNPGPDLDYNSIDSSKVLGEDDLRDVISEIITVKVQSLAIGRALGLRMGELDSIRSSSHNHEQQLNDVVCVWLRQRYNVERFGAPTWRKLVEAIDDPAGANDHRLAKIIAQHHPVTVSESVCGYGRGRGRGRGQWLAGYDRGARRCIGRGRSARIRQVKGAIGNQQPDPLQNESKFEYRQTLANFYLCQIDDQAWPPIKVTNFINLALIKDQASWRQTVQGSVDEVVGEKEAISYQKVFDDLTELKFVLFQGRPGSGKTTLMTKISQDWANCLLLDSTLLFLISLRRLNHTFDERTLATLIHVACPPFKPDEISSLECAIQTIDGKNVIFIFDGFDEYSPIGHNDIVLRLMNKYRNFLREALIVVSSRPAACQDFRKYADKQIEVVGFLKEHVIHYIQSYYYNDQQKAEELLRHLELHPNLMNMCYLPLHCAMLVFLFDGTAILPQTETEFYEHFTISMLLRSQCKREDGPGTTCLTSFDQLPPKDKIIFDKICKLAYEATVAKKQVFMRSELQEIARPFEAGSTGSDDSCLSLVVIDRYFMRFGLDETYTFLHLTFQEFLAAVYMAGLPPELIKYEVDSEVCCRFLCGLLNFKLPGAMQVFKRLHQLYRVPKLTLVQYAYESQSQQPYNYILELWNNCIKTDGWFPWGMSYGPAIASLLNNRSTLALDIKLCCPGSYIPSKDQCNAIFSLIDNKALRVSLDINVNGALFMSLESVTELAEKLKKVLILQECIEKAQVGSQKTVTLTLDISNVYHHEVVKLCWKHPGSLFRPIAYGQNLILSEDVIHYVCTDCLDNLRPIKVFNDVVITVFTVIEKGATNRILEFNCTEELHIPVYRIKISNHFLPEDYAKFLCDALQHISTDLCKIRIFGLQVTATTLLRLINNLKCCPNLLLIDLGDVKLGVVGALTLGQTLKHCGKKLEKLVLDENQIGDHGFQTLMPGLQCCTQLQQLIMHNNGLTDDTVPYLINLIQSNKYLTMLGLCNNDITEVGYSQLKTVILEAEMATTIDHIIPESDVPVLDHEVYSDYTESDSDASVVSM